MTMNVGRLGRAEVCLWLLKKDFLVLSERQCAHFAVAHSWNLVHRFAMVNALYCFVDYSVSYGKDGFVGVFFLYRFK